MQSVLVTGVGALAPFAADTQALFARLLQGVSSVRRTDKFALQPGVVDVAAWLDAPTLAACEHQLPAQPGALALEAMAPAERMALAAAWQAWTCAGLAHADLGGSRVGLFGAACRQDYSGAQLAALAAALEAVPDGASAGESEVEGPGLVSLDPRRLAQAVTPEAWSRRFSCHHHLRALARLTGCEPAWSSLSVDACAAGAMAVRAAFEAVRRGELDVAVAGGAGSLFEFLPMALFQLLGALAPCEGLPPPGLSRPFDARHRGFVMGENAGFLVLESEAHAVRRAAPVQARVCGASQMLEAWRPTASRPDGSEIARCMAQALRDAGLRPQDVDHVNTHGTSTPANDQAEAQGIRAVWGDAARAGALSLSATKSMLGHSMMGTGAVEAVITVLSIRHQVAPPTLNFERPCPGAEGLGLQASARHHPIRHAVSNSFGFGGENASLVFGRA